MLPRRALPALVAALALTPMLAMAGQKEKKVVVDGGLKAPAEAQKSAGVNKKAHLKSDVAQTQYQVSATLVTPKGETRYDWVIDLPKFTEVTVSERARDADEQVVFTGTKVAIAAQDSADSRLVVWVKGVEPKLGSINERLLVAPGQTVTLPYGDSAKLVLTVVAL